MLPDDDVVGDLDEVVDFRPLLDPRAPEPGPVDGHIRADLDVVIDLDAAGLGDLHVPPAGEFVPEAVAPDDRAGMDDDAGADEGPLANGDMGVDDGTAAPSIGLLADEDVGADDGARADGRARAR